jgi:2-methylcitrate dehydratase PrpD
MSQRRRSSRGGNRYPGSVVALDALTPEAGTSGAARRERIVAVVAVATLATGAGIASWRMLDDVDAVHAVLLALHDEMRARYATLDAPVSDHADSTLGQGLTALVIFDDLAGLRHQLAQLWRRISTELQPRTSPALHALERLRLHGRTVGIHTTTISNARSAAPPGYSGGLRPTAHHQASA